MATVRISGTREGNVDVPLLSRWLPLFLFGVSPMLCASAEPPTNRADLLKAAYLVNFARFVEWPASTPPDVLRVCFSGAHGVREALLTTLDSTRVGMRRLTVRVLATGETTQGCDVLYVDEVNIGTPRTPTPGTDSAPSGMLTIGERADFVRHGGTIGLFTVDNHLRFCINVENARRAGLKLSGALLQLASSVERDAS
jgi:hypothetical protein